ncbi:Helicase SEN1 [Yarrowia sp. B02]|nr:Helicase SEN1 [Yarrowia sp. B02]
MLQRKRKQVMFCAPSNAAVDELTKRLESQIKAERLDFEIIRVGQIEKVDPEVAHLTPEGKGQDIKKLLEEDMKKNKKLEDEVERLAKHVDKLYSNKQALYTKLQELYKKPTPENQHNVLKIKDEIKSVKHCIEIHKPELAQARDAMWEARKNTKAKFTELEAKMFKGTDVFCCTLSGSASTNVSSSGYTVDTVNIDEEGQCTEPSVLIPLQYQAKKVILVGDPKQLPPTVISKTAELFNYDQSLFVRMLSVNPRSIHTLDTQYRMHPHVSLFPRVEFYDNILRDGPGMLQKTSRPWHSKQYLTPYSFFNVEGTHQFGGKHSIYNTAEIEFADKLFTAALLLGKNGPDKKLEIGIVSPYK